VSGRSGADLATLVSGQDLSALPTLDAALGASANPAPAPNLPATPAGTPANVTALDVLYSSWGAALGRTSVSAQKDGSLAPWSTWSPEGSADLIVDTAVAILSAPEEGGSGEEGDNTFLDSPEAVVPVSD
jgi:hypothetical protein